MKAARDTWINPALALLLCCTVAIVFATLHLPLPWMIGPLLAMAAFNFGGARLRAPPLARESGQVVVGTALGLYFTPVVARQVASYWPLLLLAGAIAIAVGVLCAAVLARLSGTDRTTAFFASVPGGAAEMTILGERFGARADRVALAQTLRILSVVIIVPFVLTYAGVHGVDAYQPLAVAFYWDRLVLLLGVAAVAGFVLDRLRLPNAYMFGPLAVVIALTANGIQFSSLPSPLSNAAQLLLGCSLGARFERRSLQSAPRYVAGVLVSVLIAIAATAAMAWLLGMLWGLPGPSLVLAMAPGGIAEMCITAKVLQLGVPLVTAAHVTRVVVLITATGPSFRAARAFSRVRKI